MSLTDLASELLLQIYRSCTSISDVVNLSLTCRRMHTLLPSSQKLPILFSAAEAEFGPLQDAIHLVTYTRHSAWIAHKPPLSYPLLRQVVFAGRIADRWTGLYQVEKWVRDDNFMRRRTLSNDERYRIRRAVYRYWLFTHAFHNPEFLRTMRMFPPFVAERCQMLRQWSTAELIEIEDVREVFRSILAHQLCPSDGAVQETRRGLYLPGLNERRFAIRPGRIDESAMVSALFHSSRESFTPRPEAANRSPPSNTADRALSMDGFGGEIDHYYFIETISKLDPGQIIHLYDNAIAKWQVEEYVLSLGEWFPNNGQTWTPSWELVLRQRGVDVQEIREGVLDCTLGIAVDEKIDLVPEIDL